ncbi:MAG: twin-arginine translocase TatA/TatE family subunit [bacterium]
MTTFGFIPSMGPWDWIIILVVILIIFGPGKLPEVGKALGKSLKSFKDAQKSVEADIANAIKDDDKDKPAYKVPPENNGKSTE